MSGESFRDVKGDGQAAELIEKGWTLSKSGLWEFSFIWVFSLFLNKASKKSSVTGQGISYIFKSSCLGCVLFRPSTDQSATGLSITLKRSEEKKCFENVKLQNP